MLHQIPVSGLMLGMYIVAMDCSWLSSPFWRTRFLLDDASDLALLRESSIATVTIDDDRGLGPAPPVAARQPAPVAEVATADVPPPPGPRPARRRREDEIARARATVERSKVAVMRMFGEARLGKAIQPLELAPVVEEIAASVGRDRHAIINITRLKSKDEYTYLHSVAVCALMINLARQLGLAEEEVRLAGFGGLLHDIGKMATPVAVLDKPGGLDDAERRIIQHHPQAGYDLLRADPNVSSVVLDVCLHHHERVDGRGYPFGLSGDRLSRYARMAAVCDVYDAVTSDRPYKTPWAPAEALARMLSWQGHFDERILRAFIVGIGIHPVGALVRLRSNRLAVVLRDDAACPMTPPVRAFYEIAGGRFVPPVDCATALDPVIHAETGEHWFGTDWPAVRHAVETGAPVPAITAPVLSTGTHG